MSKKELFLKSLWIPIGVELYIVLVLMLGDGLVIRLSAIGLFILAFALKSKK